MRAQHHILLLSAAEAFVSTTHSNTFIGRSKCDELSSTARLVKSKGYIDIEKPFISQSFIEDIENNFAATSDESFMSFRDAEAEHGMPWKNSIDPSIDSELLYMKFWEWQMQFMEENLSNIRVMPCGNEKTDFSYNENINKKSRIVNLCVSSNEYRKIRMTYYDAGDNTQVFNSVWYPDPAYNLPVLGIDLLAFNRKKYLAVVDFQPLHQDEDKHASTYEHLLAPMKEKYDSLKGRMSSKFYDETQFFSKEMLFARFENEDVVHKELFPAFQGYVKTHLDLVHSTQANPADAEVVLDRQKEYDTYSAERDPAMGLFVAMFGKDWANQFVHGFLFSMSEPSERPPTATSFGGPPPGLSTVKQQS